MLANRVICQIALGSGEHYYYYYYYIYYPQNTHKHSHNAHLHKHSKNQFLTTSLLPEISYIRQGLESARMEKKGWRMSVISVHSVLG